MVVPTVVVVMVVVIEVAVVVLRVLVGVGACGACVLLPRWPPVLGWLKP